MKDKLQVLLEQRGYRIVEKLGEGAFGCVYHIQETSTGLHSACKVSDREKGTHLLREAEILRKNRCRLFPAYKEVWEEDELVILCMELIVGVGGEQYLKKRGLMQADRVLDMGRQLVAGLTYLHCRGYVYRDLKPQNILICGDGEVRLVDMGCVCKIGDRASRAGTYGFAPREQLEGEGAQPRFDFYALGMVLQAFWTGKGDGDDEGCAWKKWMVSRKNRELRRYIQECTDMREQHSRIIRNQFWIEKDIVEDD